MNGYFHRFLPKAVRKPVLYIHDRLFFERFDYRYERLVFESYHSQISTKILLILYLRELVIQDRTLSLKAIRLNQYFFLPFVPYSE